MQYVKPHYYDKFECIGGVCPDTCCAGWEIEIDEGTLCQYEMMDGALGERLHKEVDYNEGIFCQKANGRCAFLNDDNLCDIYKETQDEMCWCDTCRTYPRHVEEFEDVREISIGLSCPEAARIILSLTDKVTFDVTEDELSEDYDDFDYLLYTKLSDARSMLIKIAQDRSLSLKDRCNIVLGVANALQECLDNNEIFAMDEVIGGWSAFAEPADSSYKMSTDYFDILDSLEPLRAGWQLLKDRYRKTLFENGEAGYNALMDEFNEFLCAEDKIERWDIIGEQILVYFLFIYFCGAVYDDMIYSKAGMAVMSVSIIMDMCMAHYKVSGTLNMNDVIEIAHSYCREVEHSDDNLNYIEERLM